MFYASEKILHVEVLYKPWAGWQRATASTWDRESYRADGGTGHQGWRKGGYIPASANLDVELKYIIMKEMKPP